MKTIAVVAIVSLVGVFVGIIATADYGDFVKERELRNLELSSFSLTIFMSIITFTILDKIILFFIYVHSYANKLVLRGITKF